MQPAHVGQITKWVQKQRVFVHSERELFRLIFLLSFVRSSSSTTKQERKGFECRCKTGAKNKSAKRTDDDAAQKKRTKIVSHTMPKKISTEDTMKMQNQKKKVKKKKKEWNWNDNDINVVVGGEFQYRECVRAATHKTRTREILFSFILSSFSHLLLCVFVCCFSVRVFSWCLPFFYS